jgi:hypothetical protein
MNPVDYECAFFAQTVWCVSCTSDQNELIAVATTIRNHVIPRIGQIATYPSFAEACEAFLKICPTRPRPPLTDPAFVNTLLFNIADIYNCEYPDVTSTHDHPNGARYFARVANIAEDDWFRLEIINKQEQHPLLGTWGALQFFA